MNKEFKSEIILIMYLIQFNHMQYFTSVEIELEWIIITDIICSVFYRLNYLVITTTIISIK